MSIFDATAYIDGEIVRYTVVAFETEDGRWFDSRTVEQPSCDICDRRAVRQDGFSSYCERHRPIPIKRLG